MRNSSSDWSNPDEFEDAATRNASFDAALNLCLTENPKLLTSEGLSTLLHSIVFAKREQKNRKKPIKRQYRVTCVQNPVIRYALAGMEYDPTTLRRICADPKGWSKPEHHEGAQYYENIGSILGADGLSDVLVYQQIRTNIWSLQRELGLSAYAGEVRKYCLFGQEMEVDREDWQLQMNATDKARKIENARKLFDWALPILASNCERYDLTRDLSQGNMEDYEPAQFGAIYELRHRVVTFHLGSRSCDWRSCGNDSYRGIPCDRHEHDNPDRIEVSIGLDKIDHCTGDAVNCERFEFDRKDQSVIKYFEV